MENISAQEWLEQCLKIADDIYPCSLARIEKAEQQLGFQVREDHKQFLLKFGGGDLGRRRSQFLRNTNADYDLETILDYYEDIDKDPSAIPPTGFIFFGFSWFDVHLVIDQATGGVYQDYGRELPSLYADNVDKFLVQCLVHYYLFCTVSNKVSYSGINEKNHQEILDLLASNDFTVQTDLSDQRKIIAKNHEVNFYCDFNPDNYIRPSSRRGGIFTISGLPDQKRKTEKYAAYFSKAFKIKNRI